MSTRTAALFLFAGGVLGGVGGWHTASLVAEDFLCLIHLAALASGTWVGLLLSFMAAILIGRWRLRKRAKFGRANTRQR
jgi:hypothetical protein